MAIFRILGWASMALAVIASSPWWLRQLNGLTFKTRDKRFFNALKFLRKLHKPAGAALAAIAAVHWYLSVEYLGTSLVTGMLVFLSFFLTAFLGGWHFRKKNKTVFKLHKISVLASFLLFLLHRIAPYLLGWVRLW